MVDQDPIVRAWLLVKVSSEKISEVAQKIYVDVNCEFDKEKIQIIRADLVTGSYNLVVPVYTETDKELQQVAGKILAVPGIASVEIARVVEHVPYPSWDSKGYVTEKEAAADPVDREPCDEQSVFEKPDLVAPAAEFDSPEGHKPWENIASAELDLAASDESLESKPKDGTHGHRPW